MHCLKWAGKPRVLSPLRCARYGWINVDCDMLKCSSCQAFLCASIQATLDFKKCEFWSVFIPEPSHICAHSLIYFYFFRWRTYFRVATAASNATWEILFMARFSMPRYFERLTSLLCLSDYLNQTLLVNNVVCVADRFWMVPINEPTILLSAFVDRFKSACLLEQQLPAMKPEQLKAMVWLYIFKANSKNGSSMH